MTNQHTLYLTGKQVETLLGTGLLDGSLSIQITQGDLLTGGDYSGWVHIAESMGGPGVTIDRKGNIVKRDQQPS